MTEEPGDSWILKYWVAARRRNIQAKYTFIRDACWSFVNSKHPSLSEAQVV